MSRKNRPEWKEPVDAVVIEVVDPIEDTIEVGAIVLVDGPIDPVPLGTNAGGVDDYNPVRHSAGPMPDFETADKLQDGKLQDGVKDVTQKVQDTAQGIAGKAQDTASAVSDKAQDVAGKAQDVVHDISGKAKDVAAAVTDKAQDVASTVADKAQDAAGKAQGAAAAVTGKAHDVASTVADKAQDVSKKLTDTASAAKSAAGAAVPAAKDAISKAGSAGASGASTVGTAIWVVIQRSPLQALAVLFSVIWLFRSNRAAAAQPPVSISDAAGGAAEKVGTVAGQVQVAASNLSSQVQGQAQRGGDWFSRTLQESPLAIGAMALAVGAGLGLAVPESSYENQLLGKTRDDLVGKVQDQAQDVVSKVATVAQTAVHEAVEKGKEEAKNQGLTPEALAGQPEVPAPVPNDGQAQQQS